MSSITFLVFIATLFASLVGPLQPWFIIHLPTELSKHISMDSHAIARASTDFGRMHQNTPAAVFRPPSVNSISAFVQLSYESLEPFPVTPRGHAHSIHGQAQATDGLVVEMMSLKSDAIDHENSNSFGCSSGEKCYIDVGGGDLWIDVLRKTLKLELAPRSWTDYLYLTVGGTLSSGGISGQSFRHGPQISNVLEMDVVTAAHSILKGGNCRTLPRGP